MKDWQEVEDNGWEFIEQGDLLNAAQCAREVLNSQPDAIDSYVILSRTVRTNAEKFALLREGARIGDKVFEKEVLAAPNDARRQAHRIAGPDRRVPHPSRAADQRLHWQSNVQHATRASSSTGAPAATPNR